MSALPIDHLAVFRAITARKRSRNGIRIHPKGYRQFTKGPHRFRLEHRAKIEALLMEPIGLNFYATCGAIPDGMHVHHLDWNKEHNCHGNLQLLDAAIHNWLGMQQRAIRAREMEY